MMVAYYFFCRMYPAIMIRCYGYPCSATIFLFAKGLFGGRWKVPWLFVVTEKYFLNKIFYIKFVELSLV